ncbi:MAG TPA: translesion error-prone DNA polymerase V autoproteolytic subunit [Alphaproteobacteria bacterium]|nr:translesion error-prone DNA polymerase V autoproteolytic subunit [Alphaproteobacteria bacterium]
MTRGGKRGGAGRKAGTGQYGEPTVVMRVPASRVEGVRAMLTNGDEGLEPTIPLYGSHVRAGTPTAGDDHVEADVNLHSYLVHNAEATFFVRAQGDSMINANIADGDLLVVDRSKPAVHGAIVVAAVDGDLTVKRLDTRGEFLRLLPENASFSPIVITPETECHVWGVVCSVVHEF